MGTDCQLRTHRSKSILFALIPFTLNPIPVEPSLPTLIAHSRRQRHLAQRHHSTPPLAFSWFSSPFSTSTTSTTSTTSVSSPSEGPIPSQRGRSGPYPCSCPSCPS